MKYSIGQLIDLPDELFLMIFKNLNNAALLYSLMNINTRLDRIISDPVFTRNLTLLRYFSNCLICPLADTVIDRFCLQILPQIHYKINWLNLESLSMERILLAADYPNLHNLGLYNVDKKTAERVFADGSPVFHIFNKKIQSLVITMIGNETQTSKSDFVTSIFTIVLTVFNNLLYLNCDPFAESDLRRQSFYDKTPTFFSSTLLELHINVASLNECLYLLDGRLNQLHTFYVDIDFFTPPSKMIKDKKLLPNMRCFLLMSKSEIIFYNESIVELVQRMTNLEKLALYIAVEQRTFIDGNNLKNNIINHLPKLNKFIFNIRSFIHNCDSSDLLTSEEIQHTLTDLGDSQIIYYFDYFFTERRAQCHFYSYPYTLKYYHNITNSFSGGLFKCVREVSLFDDRPFEHEFFVRIAQAFPLLKKLSMINLTPQNQKAKNNNEYLSIIEYPHLIELDFLDVSDDYLEQFLVNTKTFLIDNICIYAYYESLKRVTNNFRRAATRFNSAKVNSLRIYGQFQLSKRLIKYFPNAKI
ncbi:unnamed protein product [Rotaria sp. Silwood2]|nr:unnamed protein product [Rotaria sp. Silwood2]